MLKFSTLLVSYEFSKITKGNHVLSYLKENISTKILILVNLIKRKICFAICGSTDDVFRCKFKQQNLFILFCVLRMVLNVFFL